MAVGFFPLSSDIPPFFLFIVVEAASARSCPLEQESCLLGTSGVLKNPFLFLEHAPGLSLQEDDRFQGIGLL